VNLAGEPLPNALAQQIYEQGHVERVWNLYGPTEDTTYSTYAQAKKGAIEEPRIGRPLANKRAYILDEQMQPVPTGVPAQLYLGGAGLARGYLHRPELTAERFGPDPFSSEPGARLYRTGDLARWLGDGQLEFLGRIDHQVKVRGYRIELGEVEAALLIQPGVREAVVMAHEDGAGGKRLVAYVVMDEGGNPSFGELRKALKVILPDYMLPSGFVQLEELPMLPNGKLDRRALPASCQSTPLVEGLFVEPRTPSEKVLAEIWSGVLNLERVGIHDNFFEMGGHSLKATRVMSRVREVFRVELPVRALFESPTVAGLSEIVEKAKTSDPQDKVPAILAAPRRSGRAKMDAHNTVTVPKL
jgi:acyl carrier protein